MQEWIELKAVFCWIISFTVTYLCIPQIIKVVEEKGLMNEPNDRDSHSKRIPTFGGVSFYLSLLVLLFVISKFNLDVLGISISLTAGLSLLFFVGLKDDLVEVKPITKVIIQIIATLLVMSNVQLYPNSLGGFMGIFDIPWFLAVPFGCFVMISIINSYNLIDGINGSASMVGIVMFSLFAYVFYQTSDYYYFFLSVVSTAFLLAFLRYNLSHEKRIFMGDTGSMIVGFMIGVLTLRFLSWDTDTLNVVMIAPVNKIVLIVALLFVITLDTVRVFSIRLIQKKGPFSPDRNHIHHVMIDYMGLSHPQAALILAIVNLLVFVTVFIANIYLSTLLVYTVFIVIVLIFIVVLFYFNRSYNARKQKLKIRDSFLTKNNM